MKIKKYWQLPSVLFLGLFCITSTASLAMAGEPRIHGFFVQPYLGYGATDHEKFSSQEEYEQWLQSMADVGAEMLFYQWTSHYEQTPEWYSTEYGGPPEADFAFYNPEPVTINGIPTQGWVTPTFWPGSPKKGGKEPVAYLLDAAQKVGIKVWLGLYLNEGASSPYNWWNAITDSEFSSEDQKAIEHHVLRSIAVVNDIAQQYGNHPALGGIYYSIEIANNAFLPKKIINTLLRSWIKLQRLFIQLYPASSWQSAPFSTPPSQVRKNSVPCWNTP